MESRESYPGANHNLMHLDSVQKDGYSRLLQLTPVYLRPGKAEANPVETANQEQACSDGGEDERLDRLHR